MQVDFMCNNKLRTEKYRNEVRIKWLCSPKEGWIKFNMDAAVSESFTALAVVVRDKNGCEAPKEGWIKLSVDAAVSESLTASAVVVRDKNGGTLKILG